MRCQLETCNKKVLLVLQQANMCRCDLTFCNLHRLPEKHSCTFDLKTCGREALQKTLIKIVPSKIQRI